MSSIKILIKIIVFLTISQFSFGLKVWQQSSWDITFHILNYHFAQCSLFFIQNESTYSEDLCVRLTKLQRDFYNVNLNQINSSFYRFDIFSPGQRRGARGNCAVVVSSVNNFNKDFASKFSNVLTKHLSSVARKDEDHFIFVTNEKLKNELLLSNFGMELKNKIAVSESNQKLEVSTVCFYCSGGYPEIQRIHIPETNSWIPLETFFPDFTRNGNGHELVAAFPTKLYFTVQPEQLKNGQWHLKRGCMKFISEEIIISKFNYTYKVIPCEGGGTGHILPNGTWTGCVGDVLYGRADIGAPVGNNLPRFHVVDITTSPFDVIARFVVRPPRISYTWKSVYRPFSFFTWFSIALTLVFVLLAFTIIQKFEVRHISTRFNRHFRSYVIFILLEQEINYPRSTPSRLLCIIWAFAGLIFTTLYRSKLLTMMTFPSLGEIPKTAEDLIKSKDYHWGLGKNLMGGVSLPYFKDGMGALKVIYDQRIPGTESNCLQKAITHEKFACWAWELETEFFLKKYFGTNEHTPLYLSKESTAPNQPSFSMKPGKIYKANFNKAVNSIRVAGLASKWTSIDLAQERLVQLQWEKKNNVSKTIKNDYNRESKLIIDNLKGPLYIFIIGIFSSIITFCVEIAQLLCESRK